MNAYLDASILSAVLLKDAGWQEIKAWLADAPRSVTISDFGRGEFVSAVSIRYRSGAASFDAGQALLAEVDRISRTWGYALVRYEDVSKATTHVANFALGFRLPDAIHIAIAQRLGATLITGDHRQQAAARALLLPVFNPVLGDAVQ